MKNKLVLRCAAIWGVIACLAIVNGIVREVFVTPQLGEITALIVSGLTLSLIVFVVTFVAFGFLGADKTSTCLYIGLQWVLMTLILEVVIGRYIANKSWFEIAQVFDVTRGDLFILVLFTSMLSPYTVSRLKRMSQK